MSEQSFASRDLALSFAQLTDAGGRQSNQDALASAQQDDLACFVVADGVGGQSGGEVASGIVTAAVIETFVREAAFGPRALQSYIDYAAAQAARRKSGQDQLKNMSTTVAALLIDRRNRLALWAHLGDTRIYQFRGNKLQAATRDHSLVQQLVDGGYCSADQIRTHPLRSTLCGAIGGEGDDTAEVTQAPTAVQAGDAFLICTDGFWEWITEREMEQAAASTHSAQEWLAAMRAAVEKYGNPSSAPRDNYTAIAIRVEETDR